MSQCIKGFALHLGEEEVMLPLDSPLLTFILHCTLDEALPSTHCIEELSGHDPQGSFFHQITCLKRKHSEVRPSFERKCDQLGSISTCNLRCSYPQLLVFINHLTPRANACRCQDMAQTRSNFAHQDAFTLFFSHHLLPAHDCS